MLCVGEVFSGWQTYIPSSYTVNMVPDKAYDGMIILQTASPTTRIQ